MSDKPLFLNTRSQRIKAEQEQELLPYDDRIAHYADVFATRFEYTLPAGYSLPPDYIEKQIYFNNGVGLVDYEGEKQIIAGSSVLRDPWGRTLTWLPRVASWACNDLGKPTELLKTRSQAEDPFFDYKKPAYVEIEDFCVLQSRQYNTLNQCLFAMSQPLIVEAVAGGELNAVARRDDLARGTPELLQFEGRSNGAKVLDLQGKDYTQNLISTINALDCEVLSVFGINSTGTAKTSGITTEESVAIRQELALILRRDLDLRQKMCKYFSQNGFEISVKIAEPLKPFLEQPELFVEERSPRVEYEGGSSE